MQGVLPGPGVVRAGLLAGLGLFAFAQAALVVGRSPNLAPAVLSLPVVAAMWLTSRRDAVTVLLIFVVLLYLIPQRYVIGPMGGLGVPALLVGYGAMTWWASGRIVPAIGFATGRQPVRIATGLFAATAVASYAAGMLRPITAFEANGADRLLLLLVGLWGITLLTADGVPSRTRLDRLLRILVLAGGLLAVAGLVQYTTGFDIARQITPPGLRLLREVSGIGERGGLPRVSGTARHAIEFGLVLAMLLPLAVHYARYAAKASSRGMSLLAAALMAVAIPLALARSALVAVTVGLLVLSLDWTWRARLRFAALIALLAVGFALASPAVAEVVFDLFANASEDPSVVNRFSDYEPVTEIIAGSPWVGIGLGTFSPRTHFMVDNQYLVTAMESGMLGVLGLIAPMLAGVTSLIAVRRRTRDSETRHLAQALIATVAVAGLGLAAFGFFSFQMISGTTFLLIGAAGALWRLEQHGPLQHQDPLPLKAKAEIRPVIDAELTRRLRRALKNPGELERLVRELPGLGDRRALCQALLDELVAALEPHTAAVWVAEDRGLALRRLAAHGLDGAGTVTRTLRTDPAFLMALGSPRRPVVIRPRTGDTGLAAAGGGVRTLAVVALPCSGTLRAAVTVGHDHLARQHLRWLTDFADQAEAALELGRRLRQRNMRELRARHRHPLGGAS